MKKIVEMWNKVSLIAKILVFALVISSIANAGKGNGQQFRMVTSMYILSTLCAAVVAVSASFIFPVTMTLDLESYQSDVVPSGIMEVLQNLLLNITDNPVNAILSANYLCILAWALLFGLAMRRTSKSVKSALVSISDAVSTVVRWIIGCAPFGIMLSLMATLGACGASGVAGGSLLLIPMACSLFGIPQDISMQAVAVGMIIGVVQDSLETAINSSGDVLFAATAEYRQWQKDGREFKIGAIVNPDE